MQILKETLMIVDQEPVMSIHLVTLPSLGNAIVKDLQPFLQFTLSLLHALRLLDAHIGLFIFLPTLIPYNLY